MMLTLFLAALMALYTVVIAIPTQSCHSQHDATTCRNPSGEALSLQVSGHPCAGDFTELEVFQYIADMSPGGGYSHTFGPRRCSPKLGLVFEILHP